MSKKGSGEHPAVKLYREKLDSIADNQLPELVKLNERLEKLKSTPPEAEPDPFPPPQVA